MGTAPQGAVQAKSFHLSGYLHACSL